MPFCFVVLVCTTLGFEAAVATGLPGAVAFPRPSWAELQPALPLLGLNVLVAFSLNVSIAFFIKKTSAVAMVLAGVVKDCTVVLLSLVLFVDTITPYQAVGFSMQL